MPDPGSTSLLYSAEPSLVLDGQAADAVGQGLSTLTIAESTAGLFCCEASFVNWGPSASGPGFLYFDRATFDFGKRLEVTIGDGDAAGKVFDGRITALEGRYPQQRPPELQVLAEDRFQDLRMVRRSRTFEDMSDEDMMRQIAGQHGLQADLDVDGPTHRVVAQVNQSDLAFLRERARAIDAELWLDGTALHAQARARRRRGEVELTWGQGLLDFQVLADLAHQRSSLRVGGWDVAAKEGIAEEAAAGVLGSELEGTSGTDILEQSFGQRPEQMVHLVPLSSGEARTLAEAAFRRRARRFLRGAGTAQGDARLRAGAHVRLQGLGPLFDGRYYVYEVRHTFDRARGLQTHFRVERPGLGAAQGGGN